MTDLFLRETRKGCPGGASGKESACQLGRHKIHGFNPWVRQIPWRRAAAHSSILAWGIPWTGEPGGLTVHRVARVGHDLAHRQEGIMKLLCPRGASVGKPLSPLDPEKQKEGALTRTVARPFWRKGFSHCHLARREPGIQASVSSFSHLPVACHGCYWPNLAPSRVQLHQTLRQAEESGSGGIVESSAENRHQDLWVSTLAWRALNSFRYMIGLGRWEKGVTMGRLLERWV